MIAYYDTPTGREAILHLGADDAAPVLILPPLFEEANRTRAFCVTVMRRLADHGIASLLPDLPGCNDSMMPIIDARFEHWTAALASLVATYAIRATISLRAGSLLDQLAGDVPHWRLTPESGARALRDMVRSTAMGSGVKASVLEAQARIQPTRLAGSLIHPDLFNTLQHLSVEGSARTVRLGEEPGEADARVAGSPIWRRAEPGSDPLLVDGVVADLVEWLA